MQRHKVENEFKSRRVATNRSDVGFLSVFQFSHYRYTPLPFIKF
jgi:hypothetical protein